MEVTALTWVIAISGLVIIGLLAALQLVAVVRPRSDWTISNVYGGSPDATDPTAYFAFNQGYAEISPNLVDGGRVFRRRPLIRRCSFRSGFRL
jgi:hypothetical protein